MNKRLFIFALVILLIPALACSLTGGDDSDETSSSQVSLGAEKEAVSSEAAVVEEVEAVEAAKEEPAPLPAESGSIEFMGITGLENLSSYQINFLMDFDGISGNQPAKGHIDLTISATKDPPARHMAMSMEGSTVEELGGANRIDFYEVEDTIYLYNDVAGGEWISMPGGGGEDAFSQGFFAPEEDLDLPKTANCGSTTEQVNGTEAIVCTFSKDDIDVPDATFESLEGKVWVDKDKNYIVKYVFSASGFSSTESGENLFDFGDIKYEYNLTNVNSNFTITVPEEAKNAESLDFGNLGGGNDAPSEDMPVLDDATDLTSMAGITNYYTNVSIPEVLAFYQEQLPAQGWVVDEESSFTSETTAMVSFEKNKQTLLLTVNQEEDGRVNVGMIQLSEE